MSNGQIYYHISPNTLDPCTMTKEAGAVAEKTWFCNGCNRPKPGYQALDACIEEKKPSGGPLNMIFGWGLPLIKKDFLFSFGEDAVLKDLYLGKLYGPNGNLIEDWVTFRGREKLIVRGNKNAGFRRCEKCGRNVYFAIGSRYLYPAPPEGVLLFESHLYGLVIHQKQFETVDIAAWKKRYRKLSVEKLPVLDSPKDGLTELTSFWSKPKD